MFRITILTFSICLAYFFIGCSSQHNKSPVIPDDEPSGESNILHSDRLMLAVGNIRLDPDSMLVVFVPNRNALAHYNGTPLLSPPNCNDCITVELLEYKPAMNYVKLRVALKNPTQLTVFDVRGIMMSNIPGMKLLNADSYTSLWDDGGDVEINPFKAFAVDWPQREIAPYTAHARIYEIEYTTFSDLVSTNVVIDASWPGNCKEPYEIGNAYTTGTFFDFDSQDIFCDVYSWNDDISFVTIDLTCLGMGTDYPMSHVAGNQWGITDATWHHGGYGPGTHRALITATSNGCEIPLFNYVDITTDASPPTVGWAKTWGGEEQDRGYSIAIDGSFNLYVAGQFSDEVDFDPGPDGELHTAIGSADCFLSKFNEDGDFQWVRVFGGTAWDYIGDVALDELGNIYLAGGYYFTCDFDPGPGVEERATHGWLDFFLCKYDPNGDFQWVRTWGGAGWDWCQSMNVDSAGDIYVTGVYVSTVDFDPGPLVDEHTSINGNDSFISKFNSDGDYLWANTWGGDNSEYCYAVDFDSGNNVYVTGGFGDTVDFDPGVGVDERSASGSWDLYLSKFDNTGDYQWVLTLGGEGSDYAGRIEIDDSDNVYLAGGFSDTTDFDPGPGVDERTSSGEYDAFLICCDTDGEFQWVSTWGGSEGDCIQDIYADDNGHLYITGWFESVADFDPGPLTDVYEALGAEDIFVNKLDSDGNYIWGRTFGGDIIVNDQSESGMQIEMDSSGNIIITGHFGGVDVDFNPGPMINSFSSNGGFDVFLTKLKPDGYW